MCGMKSKVNKATTDWMRTGSVSLLTNVHYAIRSLPKFLDLLVLPGVRGNPKTEWLSRAAQRPLYWSEYEDQAEPHRQLARLPDRQSSLVFCIRFQGLHVAHGCAGCERIYVAGLTVCSK